MIQQFPFLYIFLKFKFNFFNPYSERFFMSSGKLAITAFNMNVLDRRRRIFQLLKARIKPRCTVGDFLTHLISPSNNYDYHTVGVGRSRSECEIHIDGNMFFWIAGVAGAGLAFLTFQAITMAGRRRRREVDESEMFGNQIRDILWLGMIRF